MKNQKVGADGYVNLNDFLGVDAGVSPILNEVAEEMDGEVKIGKLNIDNNQYIAGKLKVRNIPTMVLFQNGQEIKRFVGVKSRKFLIKEIRALA